MHKYSYSTLSRDQGRRERADGITGVDSYTNLVMDL